MSKAFTRESDEQVTPEVLRRSSLLPQGARNYLTPSGEQSIREELTELCEHQRPSLLQRFNGRDADTLHTLDQRIHHLQQSLLSGEIVPAPPKPYERVAFGATVTVREGDGQSSVYRIVGVDEADPELNWVSWVSPIAQALLNTRLGEQACVQLPSGEEFFEVVSIDYE